MDGQEGTARVDDHPCPYCGGLGSIEAGTDHLGTNGGGVYYEICGACAGSGRIEAPR